MITSTIRERIEGAEEAVNSVKFNKPNGFLSFKCKPFNVKSFFNEPYEGDSLAFGNGKPGVCEALFGWSYAVHY